MMAGPRSGWRTAALLASGALLLAGGAAAGDEQRGAASSGHPAPPAAAPQTQPATGKTRKSPAPPGWRWVDTDCFDVQLPTGFKRVLRQKPDPWRPWVGRWMFRQGPERFFVECLPMGQGKLPQGPGPVTHRILGKVQKWKVFKELRLFAEYDGLPVRAQFVVAVSGKSGAWLVMRMFKHFPRVKVDALAILVLPSKRMASDGEKLLLRVGSTLGALRPKDHDRLLRSVYGPHWREFLRRRAEAATGSPRSGGGAGAEAPASTGGGPPR